MVIDLLGRVQLLDPAFMHQDDLVGHRHGLFLVMRDEHGRDADFLLDAADLVLHLAADLPVERRQRLVQEQDRRFDDQSARQRHALLLSARELADLAALQVTESDQRRVILDLLLNGLTVDLADLQTVGNVIKHGHVRDQRVVLEHHADVPLFDRNVRDILPADDHAAGIRVLQTGNDPQQRRLSAAGRSQKRQKMFILYLEAQVVEDFILSEGLRNVLNEYLRHYSFSPLLGAPNSWSAPKPILFRIRMIANVMPTMIVASAFISGLLPERISVKIFMGSVYVPNGAR